MNTPRKVGASTAHQADKETGGIDENGRAWAEVTYVVNSLEEAVSSGPDMHSALGIPQMSRRWELRPGCNDYDLTIRFEGYWSEDGSEYDMDLSFSEEPLETCPNLDAILAKGKGKVVDGEVEFPQMIPDTSKTGLQNDAGYYEQKAGIGKTSADPEKRGAKKRNPFFGIKTWLSLKAELRHTYLSTSPPPISYGKITSKVPGGFRTPPNFDWMTLPSKSTRHGQQHFRVTDIYLLSPYGGWLPEMVDVMAGKGFGENDPSDPDNWTLSKGVRLQGARGLGNSPAISNWQAASPSWSNSQFRRRDRQNTLAEKAQRSLDQA